MGKSDVIVILKKRKKDEKCCSSEPVPTDNNCFHKYQNYYHR